MKNFALPRFSYPMGLTEREKIFQQVVISQSLLKPYMSAEERPFAIDSISEKEATQSSKGRLSYRCGASEGFKTFAVTFFEDFGVLCGREMRCLMTTAKRRKQENLARFLFVPFG